MTNKEKTILGLLGSLTSRDWRARQAERRDAESRRQEAEARLDRRIERAAARAMTQDKALLARRYAEAIARLAALEKLTRTLRFANDRVTYSAEFHRHMAQTAKEGEAKIALELIEIHRVRQRVARDRLRKDPKQAAKAGALALWNDRRAGKHPKLRTVEQYALEVMRRWPVLTSAKVICGWSAKWTKDVREGRTPAV